MKDLIFLFVFIYCLKQMLFTNNITDFLVIVLVMIIYVIRFFRINLKLEKYEQALKLGLNKQKKCFIDTINHDLKIPTIAQLRGLEILQSSALGELNSEQNEMVNQISKSCKYTLNLISMIEEAYDYDNCIYSPKYEKFNLRELIVQCFNELNNDAKNKNITFSVLIQDDNLSLNADKIKMKKLFLNLLANAIQYSNRGSCIKVELYTINESLNCTISGMDTSGFYDKNFSPLGHGIEMYLCEKIIDQHNGKFFTNVKDGILYSFSFVIPAYANYQRRAAVLI